jgi:subtilisin family serine protease
MIRVTFTDAASRDAFADRFKLTSKVDDVQLDIGWHLLQFAKVDVKATDYQEVAVLQSGPGAATEKEFIVKGDPANFGSHVTATVADLGNNFYHVKATDGLTLGDHVDSIEITGVPMTLMEGNVSNLTAVNGTDATLDPTSAEAQWPRIRVASRYRPLVESFSTHEMTYHSKPELYIMDTGVNVIHPEFQYSSFEYENFWTIEPGVYGDDVGHGTGVASMACGQNLGIANNSKLMIVKIATQTTQASILQLGQAIDAIVARASSDPTKTRIVNMSWGVARSAYLDAKVEGLLDMGITVICAAGNDGIDVADISPAGIASVITVAAFDKYDIPAGFNNISPSDAGLTTGFGQSLDLFAPGQDVMVAVGGSHYKITSGTSFSAPMVAGVAAEIGALSADMIPFAQMKSTIMDTSTKDALLFEDTTFSENQNNIVYIFTSDPNTNYKVNNMTMYLGVHTDNGEPILGDINSSLTTETLYRVIPNDPLAYSIQWDDPTLESDYSQFVTVNPVTGLFAIAKPTTPLPAETKLKMVEFKIVGTNSVAKLVSPTLFFFHLNPSYSETQESDVTLALTDTNSISFFASWGLSIK